MFKQDQNILNILLGAVSEGVLIVDKNQTIIEANMSAKRMFGYENDELIKQPLPNLIPQKHHSNHSSYFKKFMKEHESRKMGVGHPIYGIRKDGSKFPIEAGLNPFNLSGKKYIMALVIDITVRKRQEQKIKKLTSILEEKVEQRTKELETAVDRLKALNIELNDENKKRIQVEKKIKTSLLKEQELNELKNKFLSLVSHEFKTPLSGILTSTMLLSKYEFTGQQEIRNKHINIIKNKVHYLNTIVNDFLSIEKLETGKIRYTPSTFKLSNVINELVFNANIFLKEGQKINYPANIDNFYMHQDKKIIELTLFNLVHNAIIYSHINTPIGIIVSQNNSETTFKVKDTGIGIPKKDQKNIFNRYFRAENVLLIQGTGIGLSIVKRHLENLGGSIEFTSKENTETIFSITIPNKAKS